MKPTPWRPHHDPGHPGPTRRAVLVGAALAGLAVTAGAGPASATPKATWPTEFPLPDGRLPEGIAIVAFSL